MSTQHEVRRRGHEKRRILLPLKKCGNNPIYYLDRTYTITRRLHSTDLNGLTRLRLGRVVLRGLGLALRWQREIGEVELAALSIGADQIRLLGVEEREGLAARAVSVDAHPG